MAYRHVTKLSGITAENAYVAGSLAVLSIIISLVYLLPFRKSEDSKDETVRALAILAPIVMTAIAVFISVYAVKNSRQ
jgi:heme/copper-type cytochrome/quinol oxidase subunit 4